MDVLKQWIICIIFCSLAAVVVLLLSPDGATDKTLKTVVSVFMICAFLSPFFNGAGIENDFELPDFSKHEKTLSDEISETMISEAENQSKIKTEELLKSLSVDFSDVSVYADVDSENCIYISYISVSLPEKFKFREKQIASNLKSMFSSEVEFIWTKE